MKRFLGCLGLFWLFFGASGQGLKVGYVVPDVRVSGVSGLNGFGSSVRLVSDFKGKLVLLDFWATWCAPCRFMVPRLDSLQRVFGADLVVLPVSYEPEGLVRPVLAAMKRVKDFALPEVMGDTVLGKLFPHRSLPHFVWLMDGKVLAVTEYEEVTATNISAALKGRAGLAEKKDVLLAYDKDRPLFVQGNGGDGTAAVYRSLLTGYVPGLGPGMDITAADSVSGQRFSVRNVPFVWLARMAYADSGRWFPPARLRLLSQDSARLTTGLSGMAYKSWLAAGNGWCYELEVPPRLSGMKGYALVREDLRRLFPAYRVALERRVVPSLVLVRTSAVDKLKTAGGAFSAVVGPYAVHLKNSKLSNLMMRLERQFMQASKLPLADGTGYAGLVDLDFDAPLADLGALNKALAAYDLAFVEKDFPAELLTIKDN